jgi:NodT family efflux transporter outer membrane factor (OMF) lipoprotein
MRTVTEPRRAIAAGVAEGRADAAACAAVVDRGRRQATASGQGRRTRFPLMAGTMLAIASSCALPGCTTVGPDYHAPKTTLAPFHNAAATAAVRQAKAPPPLDTWWTGFNDPVLNRIIERTLSQNLDLVASLARVEEARGAAREAGAQLLPSVGLNAQATSLSQSLESELGRFGTSAIPGYFRSGTVYNVGLGASWEIDLFGGLRRGAEAATAEAQAAQAEHLGERVIVAAETADAYLQLRGIQARLDLARQRVEADSRLLALVRDRVGGGAAPQRETAQAQALLSHARATIPPLRIAMEAQLNRLDVLMGAQPGTYARELAQSASIPPPPGLPANLTPADMLRHRPDIIVAERRLAASNAEIGVAISEYYPKISLAGLLGFEALNKGFTPVNLLSARAFQPELTTGLHWRLFEFGKIDAQVAQAKSGEAATLAQYRQTVLRAAEDVENAFTASVQLQSQIREVTNEVAALKLSLRASQEDYAAGSSPLTDALDAERLLLSAQDQLAQLRADSDRAAVASFRAMGGAGGENGGTEGGPGTQQATRDADPPAGRSTNRAEP